MEAVTARIIDFIRSIGIPVSFGEIAPEKQFLPGMCIQNSGLIIDMDALKYPGDLLHEAGHLAVITPAKRSSLNGKLESGSDEAMGEEMMAIAWSYAAAVHLQLDLNIVFHEDGYKGESDNLINNFSHGHYVGLPLLQWVGLTYDTQNAKVKNTQPFPHMLKWIRE